MFKIYIIDLKSYNMKKRKKYLVTAENSEAFACSLVTEPAVEELFVAFNEQKELKEKFADEKKHMITGVVAIPNKPIYRRDPDGEEYDLVFSADAIESMAKKFMKDFRQKNVTLQHQEDADGIYMFEQWIKTDEEHDKSLSLGFSKDIPIGAWFQTYYVDSNDVWQRIMSGELRGFSLECALGVEEFEKQIFEEQAPVAEPAPEPAPAQEPAPAPEPVQEAPKERGILDKILALINGGDVKEVVETAKEVEKPTEIAPEEPKEPEVDNTPEPEKEPVTEPENEPQPEPNPLEEVVKNLRAEIEELKKNNDALVTKIGEISKEPSAKPINTNAKPTGNDNYSAWREKMRQMY